MIEWKIPVALIIGGLFVYLSNRKIKRKQEEYQHTKRQNNTNATKKEDESIYKNRR